jgi:hypothetical protein
VRELRYDARLTGGSWVSDANDKGQIVLWGAGAPKAKPREIAMLGMVLSGRNTVLDTKVSPMAPMVDE